MALKNMSGNSWLGQVVLVAWLVSSVTARAPSCKKTFGKPMVMPDFSTGKAKLVSTCPYCNKVLGDTNRSEDEKEFETRVLSPEEKTDAKQQRWQWGGQH